MQVLVFFVILTAVLLLAWRIDPRVVFLGLGLLLYALCGHFLDGTKAFADALAMSSLITTICSSLGFASVVSATQCDKALVSLVVRPLSRSGLAILPLTLLAAFLMNFAIPSSTVVVASIGAPLLPVLRRTGVRPAAVAAAVMLGCFGAALNPGFSQNALIAAVTDANVKAVIGNVLPSTLMALGVVLVVFTLQIRWSGDYARQPATDLPVSGKHDYTAALAPLVPVAFYLGSSGTIDVAQSMLLGCIYIVVIRRGQKLGMIVTAFFRGMGLGYADVFSITICASVFASALVVSGFIDSVVGGLAASPEIVKLSASLTAFAIAALSGSSDALCFAINQTLMSVISGDTLSQASLIAQSGQFGRLLCPFSGAALLMCKLADIGPMDLVRRTILPLSIVEILLLLVR